MKRDFTTVVTTARADAQILGQLLAPNIAIPVVNAGPGAVFNGTFTLRRFIPTADGVAAVGLGPATCSATCCAP
jgi:hypothetical protein